MISVDNHISIGNDIVAMDAIDAGRTKLPVFYSKILSPAELEMYSKKDLPPLPFEQFVWLLWSIKESVYKCVKRQNPDLTFSPKKIIVTRLDRPVGPSAAYHSLVYFNSTPVYARSLVSNKFISTLATNDPAEFDNVCWEVREIGQTDPESQSKDVRSFVLDRLQHFFPGDNLLIKKAEAGYPILVRNSTMTNLPISFSHHHDLVFYSFISPSSPLSPLQ